MLWAYEDAMEQALRRMAADFPKEEVEEKEEPSEVHAVIKTKGTISLPKAEAKEAPRLTWEELLPQVAWEAPEKVVPWGWIAATGSLIFALIVCLLAKKR